MNISFGRPSIQSKTEDLILLHLFFSGIQQKRHSLDGIVFDRSSLFSFYEVLTARLLWRLSAHFV